MQTIIDSIDARIAKHRASYDCFAAPRWLQEWEYEYRQLYELRNRYEFGDLAMKPTEDSQVRTFPAFLVYEAINGQRVSFRPEDVVEVVSMLSSLNHTNKPAVMVFLRSGRSWNVGASVDSVLEDISKARTNYAFYADPHEVLNVV